MTNNFSYSSLDTIIEHDGHKTPLYQMELLDLARGFCGALFFALPLHYTMEMWERARAISNWHIIIIFVVLYFVNVGFTAFTGFRLKSIRKNIWFDALGSFGIGIVASTITMFLINQISYDIPLEIVLKTIAFEAVPTSIGASLAKNSLAPKKEDAEGKLANASADVKKILGATLGAFMVAYNIAPTIEPIVIATALDWYHLVGIVMFSLLISYIMVFTTGFADRENEEKGLLKDRWIETLICYIISLLVSAILLWMFGYLTTDTSFQLALPWIVVLGYVTTLGSSAGRIIL